MTLAIGHPHAVSVPLVHVLLDEQAVPGGVDGITTR
jgi:hypothetical protein